MTARIVHIAAAGGPLAAVKQLAQVISRLGGDEFEMHVCAVAPRRANFTELAALGQRLTIIEGRTPNDPAAWWQLRKHLHALRPSVAHAWDAAATPGRLAALASGVPHIVASLRHGSVLCGWRRRLAARRLLAYTDAVLVNSQWLADFARAQGLPAARLRLVRDGVEPLAPLPHLAESCAALLAELGLPAGARLIGSVAKLTLASRIKDLIWAADLLKVIRADVHLLVVGDGPQRAILERFRRQCHIDDKVHFLGPRADPRGSCGCATCSGRPATRGLRGSLVEAMAAGIPVVVGDAPGCGELVVDGENGFLVPLGDRAGLARAANRLLDNGDLAQRLGEAARARVAADFSVAAMVAAHAALYRELVARG